MSEPIQKNALLAFSQVVKPYLKRKFGQEIASMLITAVQSKKTFDDASSEDDVFTNLYQELFNVRFDGYDGPFLHLILEKNEVLALPDSFERDYQALYCRNLSSLNALNAFALFLAPDLIEVLGEELVAYLNTLYTDSIELQVGVDDHVRFFVAMDKLMETVSLLNEIEYVEKIRKISEKLRTNQAPSSAPTDGEQVTGISFQEGVDKIIIPDLAGILGNGPVLETLVRSTSEKCSGFFSDDFSRFSRFVKELNQSDIILEMFGDHWTANKEKEWLESFRKFMQK